MCRHLGWLGHDVSVSSLVLDPPHGLRVQSYAPRRQKHGLLNAHAYDDRDRYLYQPVESGAVLKYQGIRLTDPRRFSKLARKT